MSNFTFSAKRQPFMIDFKTDTFEVAAEALVSMSGYKLTYFQSSSNC